MTSTKTERKARKFEGVVVSDKMAKTIVVKVDSLRLHPKPAMRPHATSATSKPVLMFGLLRICSCAQREEAQL